MKIHVCAGLALALIAGNAWAQGVDYINPYTRRDGTFVPGHNRTMPNNTTTDNWSTRGNTNPYTGERGYRDPAPAFGNSYGSTPRGSTNNFGRSPSWR